MRLLTSFLTGTIMTFLLGVSAQGAFALEKAPLVPEPFTDHQEQVVQLPGGLSVLVLPDTRFPLVSTRLYVHAGSAYETPEQAGISHVLEHMVFKGTEKRPKSGISQEVEAAGGYLNAATSYDYTVYITDMPAKHWKLGMDIVRDMAFHPTLDPKELESEKKVILAELQRGEDEPSSLLFKTLMSSTLRGTPYERPIIGYEKTINAITAQDIRNYIKRLYQPQNMLLVVVGNVDAKDVLAEAERLFHPYKNDKPLPQPTAFDAKDLPLIAAGQPMINVQSGAWNKVYLSAALPVPNGSSYQSATLDVLAYLLGGDRTSRFYRTYKYDKQLVDSIHVSNYGFERLGVLFITAEMSADKVEPFWKALTADLASLKASDFSEEALRRAKVNLEDDLYRSKETLPGLASKLGYFQFFLGGEQGERNALDALNSVNTTMLQEALDTWVQPYRLSAAVLTPQGATLPDLQAVLDKNWKGNKTTQTTLAQAVSAPETLDLGNGRTVVLIPDTTLPYSSVSLSYSGGEALLTPNEQGLAALAANVVTKGTTGKQGLDASAIHAFLADRAAAFGASSGRKSFTLSFTAPSKYNAELFGLLRNTVEHPAFSKEETARGIQDQVAIIHSREDQPLGLAFRKLPPFLFPNSVYGYLQLGTIAGVEGYDAAMLRAFWDRQRVRPWVLAVSGTFQRDEVLAFARSLPVPTEGKVKLAEPAWGTDKALDIPMPDRNQAHLMLLFKTAPDTSADTPSLDVLETVLGGMGGLLFRDMRDEQGLGYTVTAFNRQDAETGYMVFYIGTEPDKLAQAEQGFAKIINEVRTTLIPEADIARGKQQIEGEYYRSIQSLGSRTSEAVILTLNDRPLSFIKDQIAKSALVTPEQLREVAKKYLNLDEAYVIKVLP